MSNEEHLIENALFAIRRAYRDGTRCFDALKSDQLIVEQAALCGVHLDVLLKMALYVYWDVMIAEDARRVYFHDGSPSSETGITTV